MWASIRLSVLLAAVVVSGTAAAADKPLSRAELAAQGKAATALLEVRTPDQVVRGAAFCVHPSGLFVTIEQHVAYLERLGPTATIQLVLNPTLDSQMTFPAKVARVDKELGLALVRAEGADKLPALALGSTDGLTELTDVVAFGFVPGSLPGLPIGHLPAITVEKSVVTSFQRKDRELYRLQFESGLLAGKLAGGPVLDPHGKVIGILAGPLGGATAIPVGHVRTLLARPDLQLTPPPLTYADRHKPLPFRARAVPLLPGGGQIALDLILRTPDDKERKFPMKRDGDTYWASASVVPPLPEPFLLPVEIRYADGTVRGLAAEVPFTLGKQRYRLRDVLRMRGAPEPRVVFADGAVRSGTPSGLDAVAVRLGDREVRLDLSRATELRVDAPEEPETVTAVLVASRDGKELGRMMTTLDVPAPPPAELPGAAAIRPPNLEADRVERKLPAPIADAVVGGGGRYLILHLPKVRKLAVFDVSAAKVVHFFDVPEDDIRFAAGLDKLFVLLPQSNQLQRWSLSTFEREAVAPVPLEGKVEALCMGSAAHGPLLAYAIEPKHRTTLSTINPRTLKATPLRDGNLVHHLHPQGGTRMRASADGKVFGLWSSMQGPSGLRVIVLEGQRVQTYYQHSDFGHLLPSPDGQMIHTARGLFTYETKPLDKTAPGGAFSLPAHHGDAYLVVDLGQKNSLAVQLRNDPRPLVRLTHVELPDGLNQWGREPFSVEKRLHFVPQARLLISIPAGNDRLLLYRFDLEEALEKSDIDYLLVTSRPPATATKGGTYRYELAAKARRGPVTYRLESGPKGMTVSETGLVTWPVAADFAEREASVLIGVRDATGQERFHTFTLRVHE